MVLQSSSFFFFDLFSLGRHFLTAKPCACVFRRFGNVGAWLFIFYLFEYLYGFLHLGLLGSSNSETVYSSVLVFEVVW